MSRNESLNKHFSTKRNSNRPPRSKASVAPKSRIKQLNEYMDTHDVIIRSEIEVFRYNSIQGALTAWSKRNNNIEVVQINYNRWEKKKTA